jgi:chemotaxis protein CheD
METLLGSCVAIVLSNPARTLGAMCHFVHSGLGSPARGRDTSHGEQALQAMCTLLRARGLSPTQCQAYVYGGGNMFPQLFLDAGVGGANGRWALQALADEGIEVLRQDLGGNVYRRLRWTVGQAHPHVIAYPV